ncbi:MAG: ABC transporter ATP-binding protein [Acidobacteriota bacterium]
MVVDVSCDAVSKRYRVPAPRKPRAVAPSLRGALGELWATREDFWAVRDVTFQAHRGEALGIVGRNGAGKSTILKLLSGITAPTRGEITIRGRLAAMIEVGSGFHPELTGRENAYLSGSMLGLRRREIAAKLPSIVEFSGIGDFLDVPVKFYSSGMYVRLGFAIAAHLEPDVLLVDEVLAVGDAEFQARCLRRMEDLKRRGLTMILVSHDLGAIEQLCDRALLLDRGCIAAEGAGHEVVTAYQRLTAGGAARAAASARPIEPDSLEPPLEIIALTLSKRDGQSTLTATSGEPLTAAVRLRAARTFEDVEVVLSIYHFEQGTLLVECTSRAYGEPLAMRDGETVVEFVIPQLLLAPGVYTIGATARPASEPRPVAWRFGRTTLYVEGAYSGGGHFLLPYQCRATTRHPSPQLS